LFLRHQTMDKVRKHNSFNINTPSSESYRNYSNEGFVAIRETGFCSRMVLEDDLSISTLGLGTRKRYVHPNISNDTYRDASGLKRQQNENEGVSKSFRTSHLERKLKMVQLSATRCCCIAVLWVSLVSFAATTLRVIFYFVIDSVRKLLDTLSHIFNLTLYSIYRYMFTHWTLQSSLCGR
jgi:hypothetical protein